MIAHRRFPAHLTLEHGQIAPVLRVRAEALAQPRRRLGGTREHHHAAHGAVEPVHQPEIDRAGLVELFADVFL